MDSHDRPGAALPALTARGQVPQPAAPGSPHLKLTAPTAADAPVSLSIGPTILRAIVQHWRIILGLWLVATGGLSYLIYLKVRPQYEASSLLRVAATRQELFEPSASTEDRVEPFLETQVQLITSPNVLTTAAADPKVAAIPLIRTSSDAEAELRKRIDVAIVPKTYLIKVSLTLPSASDAAAIVNAVVNAYLATTAEWSEGITRAQIKNLEAYQRELQDQADEKQDAWLALASKGNIDLDAAPAGAKGGADLPVPSRNRITLDEYKRVRELLFKTEIELVEAEALHDMRQSELQAGAADPAHSARLHDRAREEFHKDPAVASVLLETERVRRKLEAASRLSRHADDPARTSARRQLAVLSARYQALWNEKREGLLAQLREQAPDDLGRAAREAAARVETLKASKAGYEKALGEIEVSNRQEGTDAVRVAMVREALAGLRTMQDAVRVRLEQLRFDAKGDARINRISEARPSPVPAKDQRLMLWAATPVSVLALVLGLFVALEVRSGRVVNVKDLSNQMLVEVYAVPTLPSPRRPAEADPRGTLVHESRLREFLRSLDHLRVDLCDEGMNSDLGRTFLITSAVGGEGKTTVTAQLAACCARAGVSTLVIDADMRRASLSQMLNASEALGLFDVLQGDVTAEEPLIAVREGGFQLLPAGTPGQDLERLLRNPQFGQMIARYRKMFNVVLIDAPPVLPVTDALTVGRWTDGAILVVRYGTSRFALVDRTRQRLVSAGIPVLKTIFNGVRTTWPYYADGGYGDGSYAYGERGDRARQAPSFLQA